jgi:hypothetical protein
MCPQGLQHYESQSHTKQCSPLPSLSPSAADGELDPGMDVMALF